MNECPGELQKEHIGDIATLKNEVSNLKEKVEILGSIEQAITRMATLFEVQTATLDRMDKKIDKTDVKIDSLEAKFVNQKSQERIENKKNNVEIMKAKIAFWGSLAGVVGLIIVALIK